MGKDVGLKITDVRLAGIGPDGLSIAKLTGQLIQRDRNEQRRLYGSRSGGPATNRLRFRGSFSRKAVNTFAVNCIFVQCVSSLNLQKTLSALVLSGGPLRFGEAGHLPGTRDYGLASLVFRGVRRIKSSGEAFHTPLSRRNSVGPISELSSTKRSLFFHTPRAF